MRAIVTGQVGVDKGPYLEAVKQAGLKAGHDIEVFNVGQMMYREAPDVPAGRILNLPISRLNTLRRAVFKEILRLSEKRDHEIDHTLKDIMVWREEELLATEMLANILRGYGHFFMVSRGRNIPTTQTIYRLMFEPNRKKVYPSFPMSHVMDLPDTLAEIDKFRAVCNEHFIAFDPGDVDEFVLHTTAQKASAEGKETVEVQAADGPVTLKTAEIEQIAGDIMGQIYMRDFKMVDQSDMIVSS